MASLEGAAPATWSNGLPPPLPSFSDARSEAPDDIDAAASVVVELDADAVVLVAVVSAAVVLSDVAEIVVDAAVLVVTAAVVLDSVVSAVVLVLLCSVKLEVVDSAVEVCPLPMVVAAMLEQSVSGPFPSWKTPMMEVSATSSLAQADLTCCAMSSRPLMQATEQFSPVLRSEESQPLIWRL